MGVPPTWCAVLVTPGNARTYQFHLLLHQWPIMCCVVSCCVLQNPDPKAHAYFASYITKAYAALTDEVSRQNYEKYGHPDGHQVGGKPQWGLLVVLLVPALQHHV